MYGEMNNGGCENGRYRPPPDPLSPGQTSQPSNERWIPPGAPTYAQVCNENRRRARARARENGFAPPPTTYAQICRRNAKQRTMTDRNPSRLGGGATTIVDAPYYPVGVKRDRFTDSRSDSGAEEGSGPPNCTTYYTRNPQNPYGQPSYKTQRVEMPTATGNPYYGGSVHVGATDEETYAPDQETLATTDAITGGTYVTPEHIAKPIMKMSLENSKYLLVFDTSSILVCDLSALEEMMNRACTPIIPGVVLHELDGFLHHQNGDQRKLRALVVRNWIEKNQHKIHIQMHDESDPEMEKKVRNNDDRILSCAIYMHNHKSTGAVMMLVTEDKMLKIKAESVYSMQVTNWKEVEMQLIRVVEQEEDAKRKREEAAWWTRPRRN